MPKMSLILDLYYLKLLTILPHKKSRNKLQIQHFRTSYWDLNAIAKVISVRAKSGTIFAGFEFC